MSSQPPAHNYGKRIYKKIIRILLWIAGCLLLLIIIIILLLQTPWAQNIIRAKAQAYLAGKLHTRVEIKELRVLFPTSLSLGGVYIEDRQKDTLLSGKKMEVGVNMWKLFHGQVAVSTIRLEGITAKIKRALPDTNFNFQFIIDAFVSKTPRHPNPADTAQTVITLKKLQLDSIRFVYKDVITGDDMEVWLGHSVIDMRDFNTATRRFAITSLLVKDTRARYYRTAPLVATPATPPPSPAPVAKASAKAAPYMALDNFLFDNVLLDYRDSVADIYINTDLGRLAAKVKSADPGRRRFLVSRMELDSSDIRFDRGHGKPIPSGMDYAHIQAFGISLHASDLLYSPDSIMGYINSGSLKERSGFELRRLQAKFLYASNEACIENLDLRTPSTVLRNYACIHYSSLKDFTDNPARVKLDLRLSDSRLLLKDVLYFAPQLARQELFRHPADLVRVNSRVSGTMDNMNIGQLQLSGIGSTVVDVSGTVQHPIDSKRITASLQVKNISTTRKDLLALLPAGSLPSNIALPENARMSGTLTGGIKNMNADLLLATSSGTVVLKGFVRPLDDIKHAAYDLHLETRDLQLGYILKDTSTFGSLSGIFNAKGRGLDLHNTYATADGKISAVTLKGYHYRDLGFRADAAGATINATATAADPNLRFDLDLHANTTGKYPAVRTTLRIDTIDALALHLSDSLLTYHGLINADFANTDPDALDGKLLVTESVLQRPGQHFALDTMRLLAGVVDSSKSDSGRYIRLVTEAVNVQLHGQYRLTQLGDVFRQAMHPYYTSGDSATAKTVEPYNFFIKADIEDKPMLRTLLPDIKKMSPVTLDGHFSDTDTLRLALDAPLIIIGDKEINQLQLRGNGNRERLDMKLSLSHARSGKLNMYATSIDGSLAGNKLDFVLNNKDLKGKDRYHFEGLFQRISRQYAFSLRPGLLLNYNRWNLNNDNKITIGEGDVDVSRLELSRNEEKLTIYTAGKDPNDSLRAEFQHFRIATLSSFVMTDSSRFNGILQGDVTVHDLEKSPTFTSDLQVNNFEASGDTLGNLHIRVNNTTAQVFAADIGITGQGNDVRLTGSYDAHPNVSKALDLTMDIRKLQLHSIEGVSGKAIADASGYIDGKMTIGGDFAKPAVRGTLGFNNTRFKVAMLNSYFAVDSEQVAFDETGFNFDTFTIVDSTGNEAVVDGNVYTTDYRSYKFDFDFIANNFHALNSTKKNNRNYYGQLYFGGRLSVKGTPAQPAIDGRITVNDKTNLTISLPREEPGVEERKGIVEFVDHTTQQADTSAVLATDSVLAASLAGMNISVNLEIKKEAQLNIVIDPDNGDMLSVKGEALLNGGIDPGGNFILTGSYEIAEGFYDLTFNFLHRRFSIKKGSTLVWKGAPAEAEADITAVYNIDAPPIDLMQQTEEGPVDNVYRQKLPFQVQLNMKGPVLKPTITFDILLPENRSYSISGDNVANINYRLDQLRREPSELNKQVFALLLLGRFVGENPFQSSAGGMTAESFARKSASALLADQLNQLAGSLIKGVDVNFDVVSEDDYSTGERLNRTDVNVAVSKRLFNDRLTVTVGNNFEVEGPQQSQNQASALAGNLAVNYRLSKDGRYVLRAYRKNGYQGVIEGYVVETGVGFVITLDYNKFKDIFRSRKARKETLTPRSKKKKKDSSSSGTTNP